jgi:hypothetical protein
MIDAERAKILLQAMIDIMEKQMKSRYVLNFLEETAVWDGSECDGYCLYDDAKQLLEDETTEIQETSDKQLAESVKNWWEEHKTDANGINDEYNVYDDEPECVTKAKEIIGDWEKGDIK